MCDQALYDAECSHDLLAASHFEGDDGLYLVYGHPRVYGGFMDRKWCFRQHTTVGLRDFLGECSLEATVSLCLLFVSASFVGAEANFTKNKSLVAIIFRSAIIFFT